MRGKYNQLLRIGIDGNGALFNSIFEEYATFYVKVFDIALYEVGNLDSLQGPG